MQGSFVSMSQVWNWLWEWYTNGIAPNPAVLQGWQSECYNKPEMK